MKKQNSLFSTRYTVLLLVLGLALVPGYAFAQTQFAYTANSNQANSKNVSKVQTSTNQELVTYDIAMESGTGGIALTDDDLYAMATNSGVAGSHSVARITLSSAGTITYTTGCPAERSARYVAITPPLPSRGNNRYAYVATGTQYVEVVNVNEGTAAPFLDQEVILPSTSINSYGVAIGNSGAQAWVTDYDNPNVYVIDTTTNARLATIPLAPGAGGGALPRHIAYDYVSPSEFVMYVTDGRSGNRRVIAIDVVNGQVTNPTISYVGWGDDGLITNMYSYGISINSNVTNRTSVKAYVTWPGDSTKLFIIDISSGNMTRYRSYPANTFAGPQGLTWLADGRAYIGNANTNRLTTIESDESHLPQNDVILSSGGHPYWVAVTTGTYTASPLAPSPQTRLY